MAKTNAVSRQPEENTQNFPLDLHPALDCSTANNNKNSPVFEDVCRQRLLIVDQRFCDILAKHVQILLS